MTGDLLTVREAIDALAVMPGYAPMAKAAEMALQRVSATDHEGRPSDAPELVVYTVPVHAFIPETGVERGETDPAEVRVVLYEQAAALRVLARPGWRPRLAHVEQRLRIAQTWLHGREDYTADQADVLLDEALVGVRAMLDGDPVKGAEPWQKRLAVIEAKLREVHRDVEVKSMFYSVGVLDEVHTELRALIDS